jgi:hypothetical protein
LTGSLAHFRCLQYDQAGKTAAARRFIKDKNANLALEIAEDEVMKKPRYKKTISNFVPCGEEVEQAIAGAYEAIKELDARRAHEASIQNKGYRKYLKKEIPDVQKGAEKAVANALFHVRRGCWSDPLPMEQMNIPVDPDDPESEKIRLRGTSGGESNNKVVNRLVENIGQQGPELAYMKFLLRAHRWNIDIDRRLSKVLKIEEPRSI